MKSRGGGVVRWIKKSLTRKLITALAGIVAAISVCFLVLFIALYRQELIQARSAVLEQVNGLLRVSLENAMLKRDLDGLHGIVRRLGQQDQIVDVMILNPTGEVRFASHAERLGEQPLKTGKPLCPGCAFPPEKPVTAFMLSERNLEILRSVNPVANREPCQECHGPTWVNPVNGVLVVDYLASGIRQQALASAMMLSGSGVLVVCVAIAGLWVLLQIWVLRPVHSLTDAAVALGSADMEARVHIQSSDEMGRLASTFNDMAQRLRATLREIHEREDFLQSLLDSIPDGIRVIGEDYQVLKANKAFCTQVNQPMDQVVGHACHHSSHGRTTPCPPSLVICPLEELKASGGPLTCRQHHVCGGGDDKLVEVSAAAMDLSLSGRRQRLVVESIRDLSTEMKHSHEQKLSLIGMLAAGVAHEIRNPLASIRLSLSRLGEAGRSDQDENGHLLIVKDEIVKCIEITDRLLNLSVPAGRPQLVSLNMVVEDVMSLLRFEAERKAIEIDSHFEDKLRIICPDSDARMLVFNLVQNAFHAMPNGGTLTVRGEHIDGSIRLSFEDTGVGIRPEDQDKIFDPFWSRRADGIEGTGLGLSICRAIVERSGGLITVSSEAGQGSRFDVWLPDADAMEETG